MKIDAATIESMIDNNFPQARRLGWKIDELDEGYARLLLEIEDKHLRPGPTVSGPTLMAMADTAMYFAVLTLVGQEAMAVTTDLNMHFMRRMAGGTLAVEARVMKHGKRLCVGKVDLLPAEGGDPIAFATLSYALPPKR